MISALLTGLLMSFGAHSSTGDHSHHSGMVDHQSDNYWTAAPLLIPDKKRTRGFKRIIFKNLQADEATVHHGDAEESWTVAVKDNAAKIESRGGKQGGYHWIGALSEKEDLVQSVATAIYFPNPGPAPRGMLSLQKSALDISPVHLPREHQHFRAGENWDFLVRLNGKPLENTPVLFETKNRTREVFKTDQDGLVSIPFPFDFPEEDQSANQNAEGHNHSQARRKKASFVLTVEDHADDRKHITHFNYHYTTGAFYKKDLALGIGFALFGMIVAAPLLRKPKKGGKT
ncbi:hypothetical protein BOW37_09595 [Solemya velum gill symbiont]|uniref:hypothetical protein n=1 Tax=Solemya velum gill symbiont TaxID=2340 RepID=UPI0009970161|nr:hypothetical protein [Solemya velum gill symbiont]OOZ43659.1 hypothetical protein BOW37_09595 [Solemya velum gill symbiont]